MAKLMRSLICKRQWFRLQTGPAGREKSCTSGYHLGAPLGSLPVPKVPISAVSIIFSYQHTLSYHNLPGASMTPRHLLGELRFTVSSIFDRHLDG